MRIISILSIFSTATMLRATALDSIPTDASADGVSENTPVTSAAEIPVAVVIPTDGETSIPMNVEAFEEPYSSCCIFVFDRCKRSKHPCSNNTDDVQCICSRECTKAALDVNSSIPEPVRSIIDCAGLCLWAIGREIVCVPVRLGTICACCCCGIQCYDEFHDDIGHWSGPERTAAIQPAFPLAQVGEGPTQLSRTSNISTII